MKKRGYILGMALAGSLACGSVQAQDAPLYFGVKGGLMDVDFAGFDEAFNLGLMVGYDLLRESFGLISVEGEFTTTVSDGDITGGGDWDADTLAAYGVFRTLGDFYGKAKLGFADQDIKRAGGGGAAITDGDDSGFSWGIGGGWRIDQRAALELEYTGISDDLDFISIGYVTRF